MYSPAGAVIALRNIFDSISAVCERSGEMRGLQYHQIRISEWIASVSRDIIYGAGTQDNDNSGIHVNGTI